MADAAPRPWDWMWVPAGSHGGHIYLLDATGRKIGAIWGKEEEKEATVKLIVEAVNQRSHGDDYSNSK